MEKVRKGFSDKNIVFVGGTGRSGTWAMQYALAAHPQIFGFPRESWVFAGWGGIARLSDAFASDSTVPRRNQAKRALVDYLNERCGHLKNEHPDLIPRAQNLIDNITNVTYRERLLDFTLDFFQPYWGRKADQKYVAEKTPRMLLDMHKMWHITPNAKFVHIKRDPRDVLASWVEASWNKNKGDIVQTCRVVDETLCEWYRVKKETERNPNYLEVKLEDAIESPRAVMWVVEDFLDIGRHNWPDETFTTKKVNNTWQTSKHRAFIERRMREHVINMGYNDGQN